MDTISWGMDTRPSPILWFEEKHHQSIMGPTITVQTHPQNLPSYTTQGQPVKTDIKVKRYLPLLLSNHCMSHLFQWEQPLYKALSHQRNKWQPQAILRGWKVCVWFHPSPHQLSPAQRRRWVLRTRPERGPCRGTWRKVTNTHHSRQTNYK